MRRPKRRRTRRTRRKTGSKTGAAADTPRGCCLCLCHIIVLNYWSVFMPHVDFYILPGSQPDDRHQFACCLVEKAWHRGHRIHVHTESQDEARWLDQLLWQFREDSFIPHRLQGDDSLKNTPVTIDWQVDSLEQHDDVLINLAKTVPGQCIHFSRVSEIVIQSPDVLAATRKHYHEYRELGFLPNTRDLRNRHRSCPGTM